MCLGRIGGIARTIARQRGIPFVVSIHGGVLDLPPKVREEFNAPCAHWLGMRGKFFGWFVGARHLFRDSDAIITCNENEATLLRKDHPGKRVVVQPHGVPLELYRKDHRETALEAFPIIRGKQALVCVGRIDPIKNQHWLLDQAPENLQKASKYRPRAGRTLHRRALWRIDRPANRSARLVHDRVLLTGALPPNDSRLIGLMQEASAVLLPSLSETFGLVVLEAWAAGSVVLSSRTSGPSALIRPGENSWLFPLDEPQIFHNFLNSALTNRDLANEAMANRGAQSARNTASARWPGGSKIFTSN